MKRNTEHNIPSGMIKKSRKQLWLPHWPGPYAFFVQTPAWAGAHGLLLYQVAGTPKDPKGHSVLVEMGCSQGRGRGEVGVGWVRGCGGDPRACRAQWEGLVELRVGRVLGGSQSAASQPTRQRIDQQKANSPQISRRGLRCAAHGREPEPRACVCVLESCS